LDQQYGINKKDKELTENLKYFWIAPRDRGQLKFLSKDGRINGGLESFKLKKLQLKRNMRNSKAIFEFTERLCLANMKLFLQGTLKNFPRGKNVQEISNPIKCIERALVSAHRGVLVILGELKDYKGFVSDLAQRIRDKTLKANIGMISLSRPSRLKSHKLIRKKLLKERNIPIKEFDSCSSINFLKKKDNILFVSVEYIAGFEWPTVVCLGQILDMAYLRSTVDLYIYKEKKKRAYNFYMFIILIIGTYLLNHFFRIYQNV